MADIDPTKLKVTTGKMESAKGLQKSVWDHFKDCFPEPGSFIEFPKDEEGGLTASQAAQLCSRMRLLYPNLYFHSGVNATKNPPTVFVRRREEGWTPSSKDKDEEEEQEPQKKTSPSEPVRFNKEPGYSVHDGNGHM